MTASLPYSKYEVYRQDFIAFKIAIFDLDLVNFEGGYVGGERTQYILGKQKRFIVDTPFGYRGYDTQIEAVNSIPSHVRTAIKLKTESNMEYLVKLKKASVINGDVE